MAAKPPLKLKTIRTQARYFVDSKIAALKEQYPQAPDCAIEAAARAALIAEKSRLLLQMRSLLLPGKGSLDGGDLAPDKSYLLAQAIVMWHEFEKDASDRAKECVKLIPSPLPSGDRTIRGVTKPTATLSVLHYCGCLFGLAEKLDKNAKEFVRPYIPGMSDRPDEWLKLILADGYSPEAAAEFIKDILPEWESGDFGRVLTGIEMELVQIYREADARQAAGAGAVTPSKGASVLWNDATEGYVTGKDAIAFSQGALKNYRHLNGLLRPGGQVRYMRKGQRCRVNVKDLKAELERRAGTKGISEEAAEAFGRLREIQANKQAKK